MVRGELREMRPGSCLPVLMGVVDRLIPRIGRFSDVERVLGSARDHASSE